MKRELTKAMAEQAIQAVTAAPSLAAAARAMGIPTTTLKDRLSIAQRLYKLTAQPVGKSKIIVPDDITDEVRLRDRVFELEAQIKAGKDNKLDDEYVKRKIIGLTDGIGNTEPPRWLIDPPKHDDLPGVPSVFFSDWHWGEQVFLDQLNGVNEFNLEIAHRRARRLVEKTILLLRHHVVHPDYPGIVVNLGGDMISGDIHDELKESNEQPSMVVLLDLYGVLIWAITTLADEFGRVFLPCVTGNHGRNTHKPRAKNRNYTNFDWLLYQFLQKHFANDDRIKFYVPASSDAWYCVGNHRFLLTHGDQFRGGDGQIGALGPITRGNKKKQSRNSAIDLAYDTMLLGHWHQYIPMLDQIVNGSLKGYDEYASQGNFGFQLPIQALWITHRRLGITQNRPIYLEDPEEKELGGDWVSWKETV